MDVEQPEWIKDEGIIVSLSEFITGWDWFRLCRTIRRLREYAHLNKGLGLFLNSHHTDLAQSDKTLHIPSGITHVTIPNPLKGVIPIFPESIKAISVMGDAKMECPSWIFPPYLETLDLSGGEKCINLDELRLPESLRTLHVWGCVCTRKSFPPMLQDVVLATFQPTHLTLPSMCANLQILAVSVSTCGRDVHFPVCIIPRTVVSLRITTNFSVNFLDLPENLELFDFSITHQNPARLENLHLPRRLKSLSLHGCISKEKQTQLPDALDILSLSLYCDPEEYLQNWSFPNSLSILTLNVCGYNLPENDFVKRLVLPKNLKSLVFLSTKCQVIGWHLPQRLQSLNISCDSPVEGWSLPSSLKTLKFDTGFNQPVELLELPEALVDLRFGPHFRQPIQNLKLPPGLMLLELGRNFPTSHSLCQLPLGLKKLILPKKWKDIDVKPHIPPGCQIEYGVF